MFRSAASDRNPAPAREFARAGLLAATGLRRRVAPAVGGRRMGSAGVLPATCAATGCRAAFTLVELIVVISLVVILLAIGVPALSSMNADARQTSAQQTINGTLVRAYSLAQAQQAMTAVRFFPAEWHIGDPNKADEARGRQSLAILRYVGPTAKEVGGSFSVAFSEYFERAPQTEPVLLPDDVWAAPLEALQSNGKARENGVNRDYPELGQDFVLKGNVRSFSYDADPAGQDPDRSTFMQADDFLILCDPRTGVRAGVPAPFQIRAHAPPVGHDTEVKPGTAIPYQRYAFSGVVTYRREPFLALGLQDAGGVAAARQQLLLERGRPYMIQRFSGALISAARRPQ